MMNYGGNHTGRIKLLKEIVSAIRKEISDKVPIFCRISAIDGLKMVGLFKTH